MPFIETIDPSRAEGPLVNAYARFGNPDGSVDDVMRVHSLNPESMIAHGELYVQSMHRPSPLSRAEREMIGVTVSRLNGCGYCLTHHAAGLGRYLAKDGREAVADALKAGDDSGLSGRERALVDYAAKLTREPSAIGQGDIDAMRGAGVSDREILDAAQAAAYFAYANRVVLGLGATLEEGMELGQHPPESGS